jgi:hypothetical protein
MEGARAGFDRFMHMDDGGLYVRVGSLPFPSLTYHLSSRALLSHAVEWRLSTETGNNTGPNLKEALPMGTGKYVVLIPFPRQHGLVLGERMGCTLRMSTYITTRRSARHSCLAMLSSYCKVLLEPRSTMTSLSPPRPPFDALITH